MSSVQALIVESELEAKEIVVGMVMELGVVTNIPSYDLKLTIHRVTQEDKFISSHLIYIKSAGKTAVEYRNNLIGKHVITVRDELGRACHPKIGRPSYEYKRNVTVATCSNNFELVIRGRSEPSQETIGILNEKDKRKFFLLIPTLGWHLCIMSFKTTDGQVYRVIADGEAEKIIMTPKSNEKKSKEAGDNRKGSSIHRPSTAKLVTISQYPRQPSTSEPNKLTALVLNKRLLPANTFAKPSAVIETNRPSTVIGLYSQGEGHTVHNYKLSTPEFSGFKFTKQI